MELRRKLKVAMVTPGAFSMPSGFTSSVERVVDEISRRIANEARLYVYSRKSPARKKRERLHGVIHIRPSAAGGTAYCSAVIRSLRRVRPHIIQIENRPSYVHAFHKSGIRAQLWLSLHSVTFMSPARIGTNRLIRALSMVDRIIVNSEFLKKEVIRLYPASRSKITIQYPGADPALFRSQWESDSRAQREVDKREWGLAGRKVVLFAGRLVPIKGAHIVLDIWPQVLLQHPDAVLVVAGSAYCGTNQSTIYSRRLRRMALPFGESVKFTGCRRYSDMPRLFRMADVTVVPSADKEAFGLVNAESLAAGTPVIASDSGGIGEIVKNGENGYLLHPNRLREELLERINELLSDDAKRKQLGECGARIVREQFSWRHTADKQMSLYARYSPIFRSINSHG